MNKTQQLSQYESQCCTYLPLGMETLNMLEYLSGNEPGPFCSVVKFIDAAQRPWKMKRRFSFALFSGTRRSVSCRSGFPSE